MVMAMPSEKEPNTRSERTCAGCGRKAAPSTLLRVVLGARVDGAHEVVADVAGGAFGRGAHVHPSRDCLAKACAGGFSRVFKANVKASAADLSTQIGEAFDRRIAGLVTGAWRAGHVALGADAALMALAAGAALAVVACDAGSVTNKIAVSRAVAEGRAVAWLDKAALGKLFGRDEVGIFAVTHAEIAREIQEARSRSEACRGREER